MLTTRIAVTLDAALTSALDLVSPSAALVKKYTKSLASGVGADQADRIFSDTRTIAASTAEDLDLSGSLLDALGGTFILVKVKLIMIVAAAANTNSLKIGGDAASIPLFGAVADFIVLPPGGVFLWTAPAAAGLAVTATTGDILQVENGGAGTSVTYDVIIIGTSA